MLHPRQKGVTLHPSSRLQPKMAVMEMFDCISKNTNSDAARKFKRDNFKMLEVSSYFSLQIL